MMMRGKQVGFSLCTSLSQHAKDQLFNSDIPESGLTRQTDCRDNLAEEVNCIEDSKGDQKGQQHLQMQVFLLARD